MPFIDNRPNASKNKFTDNRSTPKPSMYQNVYDALTMETGRPETPDVAPAKPIIPTISTLTPELQAKSRPLTNQEQKYLTTQKNIELAQKYPKNYYTGVSGQMESFGKGLLPTSKESPPDIEQAYPITHAAGQLAGLAATALLTRGIAPAVTEAGITAKAASYLPAKLYTIARMAAGNMAQTGATFGIKEFIDNMAEMYAGKDKSSGEVIKKTLESTAFGSGLGLAGAPASPFMRIPAEMGYGYMTAKIEGADDLHAGINAGMFGLFGLLNAKNLSEAYKVEAYNGSKRALVDRLMAKGADEDKASRIADKYFQYAMRKTGGWKKTTIKDFDAFSKAMKKGWDIAKEGEDVGTAGSGGITDTPLIPPFESTEPPPAEPYGPSDILPQELQVTPQQKLIKKPDTTVTDYMQDRGEITPIQLAAHGLLSMTPTEMKADLKTRLSTAGIGATGLGIVDDMDIARPSDIKPMLDAIDKALNGASKEVKTELNKTKIALKYWNSEQFGKLVNKNTDIISQIKDELISGNPGTRIRDYSVQGQGGTADVIGIPSTYPEYFRGKGLTASDVIGYIDIIQGGGKLAEGQQATIEDLIRDKRAHVITEVKSVVDKRRQVRRQTEQTPAGYLNVGDVFNIKGEKHQVIGEDADGNKIIKNGTTITADPFDQISIDKGLKGIKNKPVPKGVMPSAEEETSKVSEDANANANAEKRLLGKTETPAVEGVPPVNTVPKPPKPQAFTDVLNKMQEKKTFEHDKLQPQDKINSITLEQATKKLDDIAHDENPQHAKRLVDELNHHLEEGVQKLGKATIQDAIASAEGKVMMGAAKGEERKKVIQKLGEVEPEINKVLKGEVQESPSYDEYIRKESGRGTNLDYEIRYAKELRDQANKNSEWIDRNVKSFFPAEMKWNMAGNARLKELADNQEKYVKQSQRVQPVSKPEPDIKSLTKDRGALIPKSMSNKDRTITTLGKVGTTIQFGVPGFNKDYYTITDINDSGDIKISGEKTYRSPTDFKRADIHTKSIGTPENINTIALSDILLKSLQEGEQLNKIRILGITAKALNVPVSDLKNHKSIDEAMEYAIVKRAREILQVVGVDHYQEMKNLYNQQPNLTVRTSTSITNQAYSTPVPLAYLMDKYLNITPQDKVYEPTAGNGMLVIGANPENTWVNEIDKKRSEHLNDAGYRMVTNNDASKEYKQGHKTVDVSVMNPPFGIAEQKTYDGFKISKLEHQIAIEALNAMKDRGRAAIIIGGHNFKNGNMVESDRIFLNYLYSHYNVTHNMDIDGDIYRKMGASYPIRLITVNGRKTTPDTQYAPTKEQIESAMNFDRVKEILEKPVEKGIVKAEQGAIHDNVQSVRGSVGEESKGVAGKGEAAGVSGIVTTERKPIREEQRPATRRGSRTDVGTKRAGIDRGVPEEAIRPVHKEGIRPLDVTVGISQQQSGVKASGVSDLSESDFGSLINEVRSEGQEPTISEETTPYGEDFDVKRYEKVKPYFAQVLDEFTKQDKTVKEFIKHILDKYNESIVPYLKAFHRDISTKAVKQEIPSNEFQVPYKPQSKAEAGDNLIPKNMVEPARKALKELSDKVGDIDDYVKNKLGYTSGKDFQSAFSAEQIDGLAMAINAIDNGQAIIVGDQTGVGKGRQAAGIIRYANKLGKKPIFFTATPKLFSDIYRDLVDIGHPIVPFIMHTDATKASVYDEDGNKIFKPSGNPAVYKQMVNDVDAIMSKYKAIVLPYSQIRTKNIQQQIINQLAKDNIIILDESHMASGESETGNFVRHILKEAKGALYLSATYAKRPDTMPLYYRTKLGASKMSINDLVSAVNNGGVLLQQYIANGLSGMGQMIRRELNYSGVKFEVEVDTDNFEQDSRKADDITDILRQIVAWDGKKQLLIDAMDEQARAAGGRMVSKQQAAASVTSSNFAATVHNNISQLLLGLKADATVNRAIQALKEGKKPFIGVMNTMESFLEHMVSKQGASVGEPIGFTFRDVLKKSLTGTLRYAVTDAMGNKSYDVLKVDEMPFEFQSAYRSIESDIDTLDTSVPASPIDYIKNKISEAGYKVDEITGRAYYIDYSKKIPVLAKRSQREISDRNAPVNNFNSGKTDALIVNAAGSTGLSIHSSSKFKDQRQRKGIIAQADLNIDTFMQLLGRINRKGQVNLPEYTILQTALPAEIRPAIVLSKKMSSLNANISANKNSATTMKDIPEMMNHYGDKIVIDYLRDNSNVNDMLGDPLDLKGKVGKDIPEDAFKKVSGRMALLPVEVQKDFYAQIESDYVNLIDYLNQIGENNLEAKDYNFEAKALEKTQIYKGTDESNPFTSDTYLEKVSVKVLKQPYNTAKIKELIVDKTSDQHYQSMVVGLKRDAEAYKETLKKKQTLLGRIFGKGTTGVDDDMDYVASRLSRFRIGNTYDVAVTGDYVIPGVLIDVKRHKGDGSPVAPSKISLIFAVPDSTQIITMPLSKKLELSATHQTSEGIARNWDSLSATSNRETRYIVTGNMVQGFDRLSQKAEIVNYTTDTGDRKQGILIPKSIKDAEVRLASTSVSHEDVYNILSNNRDIDIVTTNSEASVNMDRDGDLTVVVPKSKLSGAKYFLNDKIRDLVNNREFQSVGIKMRAFVPADSAKEFLKVFEEETNIRFAIPKRLMGGKDEFTIAEQAATYGSPLTVNEITAYHGSPYRFDKFSSEKIGTGEGAQAFGHGLYFTDEKEIAKSYADGLRHKKIIDDIADSVGLKDELTLRVREAIEQYNKPHADIEWLRESLDSNYYSEFRAEEKQVLEAFYKAKKEGRVPDVTSNTYAVTLHKGKTPEQYEYLRWDLPVSRQIALSSKIRKSFQDRRFDDWQIKSMIDRDVTGEQIYTYLASSATPKGASELLLKSGIDGIKYPSGSLSGKESDKFNYVVFDPESVTIESVGEKQTSYNRRPDYDQQTYNKAKTRLDKISSESGGVGDRGRDVHGIRTLGIAIRRDLLQKGRVDLRGQIVNNTEDIAIVSQVFRSPQFETFRIGYVKDGLIVGMDGVSSRMPGMSKALVGNPRQEMFKIINRAKRLGAGKIFFLHNHPTGNPSPSKADLATTTSMILGLLDTSRNLGTKMPSFMGHVIIDSGKYATIDASSNVGIHYLPGDEFDRLLTAEQSHEYLRHKIESHKDVVNIGQALKQPDNFVTILYRGSDGKVNAIEAMPINQFKSKDADGILRNRARSYGALGVVSYYDGQQESEYKKVAWEKQKTGILLDAVYGEYQVGALKPIVPQGRWMGVTTDKTTVRVAEEVEKYGFKDFITNIRDTQKLKSEGVIVPTPMEVKFFNNAINKYFTYPATIAKRFPKFKEIYKRTAELFKERDTIAVGLVNQLEPYFNLTDKTKVNEFLEFARKQGHKLQVTHESMSEYGLSDTEQEAVMSWRKAADSSLKMLKDFYMEMSTKIEDLAAREEYVADVGKTFEALKDANYVPFGRFGDKYLAVMDNEGNLISYYTSDKQSELVKLSQKYDRTTHKIRIGEILKTSDEAFSEIPLNILTALKKLDADTLGLELSKKMAKEIGGFPEHLIHAKMTPGYTKDFERSIANYAIGISNYIAHKKARRDYMDMLSAINPKSERGLYEYAKEYTQYIGESRPEAYTLRKLMFYYYIGPNIKTNLVNLTQTFTTTYPVLSRHTKSPAGTVLNALNMYKSYMLNRDKFTKQNPLLAKAIQSAITDGTISEQMVRELQGRARPGKVNTAKLDKVMGAMMAAGEHINRTTAFIAGFNIAQKDGKSYAESVKFAEQLSDDTQFVYSKLNRPEVMRGRKASLFIFRNFMGNYLSLLKEAGREKEWGQLARMLITMGLLAGVSGFVGIKELFKALEIGGVDVKTRIKEAIPGTAGDVVLHGFPWLIGADLSGSIGVGELIPDIEEGIYPALGKGILGVVADIPARAYKAGTRLREGKPYRAVEALMPEWARNPMVAYRWAGEDVRYPSGKKIAEPTGRDIAYKAVGIQPSRVSSAYERENAEKILKENAYAGDYNKKYAEAVFNKNREEMIRIRKEIAVHNKTAKPEEKIRLNIAAVKYHLKLMKGSGEIKQMPKQTRGRWRELQDIYRQ